MVWGTSNLKSCDSLLNRIENNDHQLVDLIILPMKTFGREEVLKLAKILESKKNTTLKSISASGHSIPNDALECLGYAIASQQSCHNSQNHNDTNSYDINNGIISLSIGNQNMGDDGIKSLCKGLITTNGGSIQTIDLSDKSITKESSCIIGKTFGNSSKLNCLILNNNSKLGDEGLDALCKGAMDSSSCPFVGMKILDLSECNVGVKGLESLVECFSKCNVDDDDDDVGNKTRLLTRIDFHLNSNPLGPAGCIPLANLISGLSLSSSLSYQPSIIQSLSIRNCGIGDEGLEIIAQSFITQETTKALTKIDLSSNNIGSKGIKVFALAMKDSRDRMKSFHEIILADNPIGEEGIIALANDGLTQDEDRGDNSENQSSPIFTLDLSNTNCGVNGAIELIKCSSISSLRLFNNKLGSHGFKAISSYFIGGHKSLNHLDLGGNKADGDAVANLLSSILIDSFVNKLKTLELGGNENNNEDLFVKVRNKSPGIDIPLVKETPKEYADKE